MNITIKQGMTFNVIFNNINHYAFVFMTIIFIRALAHDLSCDSFNKS